MCVQITDCLRDGVIFLAFSVQELDEYCSSCSFEDLCLDIETIQLNFSTDIGLYGKVHVDV